MLSERHSGEPSARDVHAWWRGYSPARVAFKSLIENLIQMIHIIRPKPFAMRPAFADTAHE